MLIDGVSVGTLTSGNFSPVLQCGIGMGLLRDAPDANTPATVALRGREISATITPLPFVRKAK